jgi:hypothetical protein
VSDRAQPAEELFARYFARLYPPGVDLERLRREDQNPGGNASILQQIEQMADIFVRLAPRAVRRPDLVLDYSDASVHRLGSAVDRALVDDWIREADASDASPAAMPTLVAFVTHGALYVGECVRRNHAGSWQVRSPLWESLVRLESAAGIGDLPIFHWWLKALTGGGAIGDRYRTHVEVPGFDAEKLPMIAPPERKLPTLRRVRYDTLHRHLKAHLPELSTVGDDFPSPERLDELAFEHLDFLLVGGGRMLLMHGPTARGIHLFWLDASGFCKAAFVPQEGDAEYSVGLVDGRIRITLGDPGRAVEMLWWGP